MTSFVRSRCGYGLKGCCYGLTWITSFARSNVVMDLKGVVARISGSDFFLYGLELDLKVHMGLTLEMDWNRLGLDFD